MPQTVDQLDGLFDNIFDYADGDRGDGATQLRPHGGLANGLTEQCQLDRVPTGQLVQPQI